MTVGCCESDDSVLGASASDGMNRFGQFLISSYQCFCLFAISCFISVTVVVFGTNDSMSEVLK